MSAIREVKYLRELHHPNVIEVIPLTTISLKDTDAFELAPRRVLLQKEPESRTRVS